MKWCGGALLGALCLGVALATADEDAESCTYGEPLIKAGEQTCVGTHCVSRFVHQARLAVTSVTPNSGPLVGGTKVEVSGQGIRDFGTQSRCKIGEKVVQAGITTQVGAAQPFEDQKLVCVIPNSTMIHPTTGGNMTAAVPIEISLTGESYTNRSGVLFFYYHQPTVTSVATTDGAHIHTRGNQLLHITGSGFTANQHPSAVYTPVCRFRTSPDAGRVSEHVTTTTEAVVLNDTLLTCFTPPTTFSVPALFSVALNAMDFTPESHVLEFEDHWTTPHTSSSPSAREMHTMVPLNNPDRVVLFGGYNGKLLNDLHILNTNVFKTFRPTTATPLRWTDISAPTLTTGDFPAPCAQHTATPIGHRTYIYGGETDWDVTNDTDLFRPPTNELHVLEPSKQRVADPCGLGSSTQSTDGSNTTSSTVEDNLVDIGTGLPVRCCDGAGACHSRDTNGACLTTAPHNSTAADAESACAAAGMTLCLPHQVRQSSCCDAGCGAGVVWTQKRISDPVRYVRIEGSGAPTEGRARHTANPMVRNGEEVMVVFGGRSHVYCGFSRKCYEPLADLWTFNPRDSSWVDLTASVGGERPRKRSGHAATVTGDESCLWLFGGEAMYDDLYLRNLPYNGSLQLVNDLHSFNCLSSDHWRLVHDTSTAASMPSPRQGHTLVAVNHTLVLFGGFSQTGPLDDLWLFSTLSETWTRHVLSGSPSAVAGHSMAALGGKLHLFGGLGGGVSYHNDLHVLDLHGAGQSLINYTAAA